MHGRTAKPNWTMRLAVISTVATVLALGIPLIAMFWQKSEVEEIKTELRKPETKAEIKEQIKSGVDEFLKDPPVKLPQLPKPPPLFDSNA